MKERPILFGPPMARGVLSGQKTSIRRPVKHQPDVPVTDAIPRREYPHGPATIDWYWRPKHGHLNGIPSSGWDFKCPYGQPGDRLWGREPFGEVYEYCDHPEMPGCPSEYWHIAWKYRADAETPEIEDGVFSGWKPNIHMPRAASRILLEITDVRVERLRNSADLTLLDELGDMLDDCACTAGKEFSRIEHLQSAGAPLKMIPEMYGFKAYWDEKNGIGSFDSNPWVWVVEFNRICGPSL